MQCLLLAQSGHFNSALPRTSELSFDRIRWVIIRYVVAAFGMDMQRSR